MNLRFTTVDENGHIMSQTMPRGQRSGIVWCRKPETEFDLGVPRHHSLSLPSTQSRDLDAILGGPVRSFSYPYGEDADVDDSTRRMVKEAGFSLACFTVLDVVRADADPYWLPRFTVWDWDGDQFAKLLYI